MGTKTWLATSFIPALGYLFIGDENQDYPYYLHGMTDEIRIYNRVLSANE